MAPIVHGLRVKWSEQVNFIFLDILDRNSGELKKALGYRGIPQFFLVDGNGEILEQWIGEVPEQDLDAAIEALFP